jgi:hypothetical protein
VKKIRKINLKKWLPLILIFVLAGCGANQGKNTVTDKPVITSDEVKEDDFIYRLVTEKSEYVEGEKVSVFAELEYVGDKEEISISHAASPFYFPMKEETRNYDIPYPMDEPLITTILYKGKPHKQVYHGAGGYSSEDDKDYINFMNKIIDNQFPSGFYTVNGMAHFYVESDNQSKQDFKLTGEISFKVIENK